VNGKTKYIGIDPSSILIERAQERYSSENRKFAIADAYEIPLMDDSMNAVMSVWVWSHLESPTKAAREMSRVLMEGGRFLIITANPETYEERKAFYRRFEIMENLLVGDFDLGNGKTLTNSTLYLHSREEIEEALRKAGLRIESATRMGISELGHQGWYLAYEGSVQK
jgi:ubiquinone/menaquinone biosynthesis C-methylase UbiE